MENLGKYLYELREQRGIDYRRIHDDIRLEKHHIKALEENRLFDIGHYGFVKALVYNYARYLEADLPAVMHEFGIMMPDNTKKEFNPRKALKEKKIMLSTNFLWTIGITVFAAILGSILYYSYINGWLATPEFFGKDNQETRQETAINPEPPKPDSLRLRMRVLSESIPQNNMATDLNRTSTRAVHDTTDYVGNILGKSPVNVPVN